MAARRGYVLRSWLEEGDGAEERFGEGRIVWCREADWRKVRYGGKGGLVPSCTGRASRASWCIAERTRPVPHKQARKNSVMLAEQVAHLDALQKEIMDMLTNMTPEELAESSRSIDFDEEELSDEDLAAFRHALTNSSTRNLQ